jgi:predicted RNase H-like nuclease (RuvC/YqgF family)
MNSTEAQLAHLETKLNSTAEDVGEIKLAMRDIASSLRSLAILEQKHSETKSGVDELKSTIKDHEGRIQALEIHDAKGLWVERIMWVLVAGVFAAIAKGLV